jgi:hypothetical protein
MVGVMKIKAFSPDQLRGLIEEATVDQSEDQWHESFLSGVAGLIAKSPIAYRSFGPFWWAVKKYLQDEGLLNGEPVNAELFEQVTMGDKTLDLAAAFAFHDSTSKSLTATETTHTVSDENGESLEYQVIDEELEARIAFA